jgi:hypothetical protein
MPSFDAVLHARPDATPPAGTTEHEHPGDGQPPGARRLGIARHVARLEGSGEIEVPGDGEQATTGGPTPTSADGPEAPDGPAPDGPAPDAAEPDEGAVVPPPPWLTPPPLPSVAAAIAGWTREPAEDDDHWSREETEAMLARRRAILGKSPDARQPTALQRRLGDRKVPSGLGTGGTSAEFSALAAAPPERVEPPAAVTRRTLWGRQSVPEPSAPEPSSPEEFAAEPRPMVPADLLPADLLPAAPAADDELPAGGPPPLIDAVTGAEPADEVDPADQPDDDAGPATEVIEIGPDVAESVADTEGESHTDTAADTPVEPPASSPPLWPPTGWAPPLGAASPVAPPPPWAPPAPDLLSAPPPSASAWPIPRPATPPSDPVRLEPPPPAPAPPPAPPPLADAPPSDDVRLEPPPPPLADGPPSEQTPEPEPEPSLERRTAPSTRDLVRTLTERHGELFGVADTCQVLAEEVVERAFGDAAAIVVPDGSVWRVSGGVGLRPMERRLILEATHWLISEIALGGRALLVGDSEVVRPRLIGAPLASWDYLLAVPVPEVNAAVLVARSRGSQPFGQLDLEAVMVPVEEAAGLLSAAMATRRLARLLAPLADDEV